MPAPRCQRHPTAARYRKPQATGSIPRSTPQEECVGCRQERDLRRVRARQWAKLHVMYLALTDDQRARLHAWLRAKREDSRP